MKMPAMFDKVFGTKHDRKIKKLRPMVARVNALAPSYEKASDAELKAMTPLFREKLDNGASLDDILPDAFAVVREAAWRSLKMRHYDCQIIGGIILHDGSVAEMRTGEGKTLVATLPCYLNALSGKGAHVVTVNDYLATRDAEWMGKVHNFLGLSVGCISHGMSNEARRAAYKSDITYGNNSEFGFDFLRDNMKLSIEHMVQSGHNFAIVDEVDSILIDEARTPLIISGAADADLENYYRVDKIIPGLKQEIDFVLDEESRAVSLTQEGIDKVETLLEIDNLFLPTNIELLHHVNQALRAHFAFKRDKHYVVEGGKVVIVDPHTGRKMPGRRWSDGLHQAIEAKEKIKIEKENETLATITYQKYFLKYDKLSGMTGTADTEASEFQKIYDLDTTVIPTNRPIARLDHDDVIYKTEPDKFRAVVEEIRDCHERRQPCLVGTASVEKSELVHKLLVQAGIPHNVLNAKYHMSEASIVAQAGTPGAVTISTNMAGRGTDIVLGGNAEALARDEVGGWDASGAESREDYDRRLKQAMEQYQTQCEKDAEFVKGAGGLHVIGTERHEARRIDNQLRGRSGRQGDPGSSRFFLSLEDDLLRIFGSDRLKSLMERLGMEDGVPLEHPWLSKSVGNAQQKVEGRNFGIRKNLLEYDEVMSQQRDAVYGLRNRILGGEDTRDMILETAREMIAGFVSERTPYKAPPEEMDVPGLNEDLKAQFNLDEVQVTYDQVHMRKPHDVADELMEFIDQWYASKEELIGGENTRYRERYFLLKTTDFLWKKHLQAMSHLRGGIGLRGYGQRNPLLEYKKEGFEMFNMMLDLRDQRVLEDLFENLGNERALTEEEKAELLEQQLQQEREAAAAAMERANRLGGGAKANVQARRGVTTGAAARQAARRPVTATVGRDPNKLGRNEPCWCGSGKKYKKCHMGSDKETAAAAQA